MPSLPPAPPNIPIAGSMTAVVIAGTGVPAGARRTPASRATSLRARQRLARRRPAQYHRTSRTGERERRARR
ncbi:hypothetical protein [Dactylosporangium sp. NPDC000521]|uniref:hypothetical protein n=1 Tax=Dactylosporangium sp. NPDC000521 TaxID=3363975 RepID=UPI0036B98FF4